MRIDIVTLFPELCDGFLSTSILGRARAKHLFEAHRRTITPMAAAAAWCCMLSPLQIACALWRTSAPSRAAPSPMWCF